MKAERLAEAEMLRARGREAAQRIRARADREVVEIVAEARRESEILRGEGEAERNAIFADAFQRDPEILRVLSLDERLYRTRCRAPGTTMVLSPQFRVLPLSSAIRAAAEGSAGTAAAAPAPRRRAPPDRDNDRRQPVRAGGV